MLTPIMSSSNKERVPAKVHEDSNGTGQRCLAFNPQRT